MMKKIIISGNKEYGLAKALFEKFPDARFISRTNENYDLAKFDTRDEFAKISLDYDVFINCSALSNFRQTLLLQKVYQVWLENSKKGQIISFGSTADTPVKGTQWMYPIEKKALKSFCRNLSMASLGGHGSEPSGIRITYLSMGYLATPNVEKKHPQVRKIDTGYIANLVEWVLSQPENVNLSEITIDPIQYR